MADPDRANSSAEANPASDNITLRIVILAHGNRSDDDLYLVLNLDTTVSQLKLRIQESLSQHPNPEHQRLIYQGRPLVGGSVRLRDILRVDQRTGTPSHVVHLVVRDPDPSNASQPDPVQAVPMPQQMGGVPMQQMPQQPHIPMPGILPQDTHMRLHNQLHNMQHHLQHAQALRATQARVQAQQAQAQAQAQALSGQARPLMPQPGTPSQASTPVPIINDRPSTLHTPQPGGGPTRIEERIGPNGEHIRTVIDGNGNTSSTTMSFRITGLNMPNPLDRPSSAPGASPTAESDPANRAANGPPANIQIHAHPPQLPAGFPFPPGMHLPLPIPTVMPPLHAPMMATAPPTQAQTMAWLLSSPQGPQGIVFAPGHGLFTTLPPITTLPSSTTEHNSQLRPTPTVPIITTQAEPRPAQPQAQLVPRSRGDFADVNRSGEPAAPQQGAQPQPLPAEAVVRPAHQQQNAQNENNDLFQLLRARGWLFLRLYLVVFLFSQSGTWRRLLMLGCAIIFCLLPQQNPLTTAFNVVRQHFDNLIGPPNIPPRQPQGHAQDQPNQQQGQQGGQNTRTARSQDLPSSSTAQPRPAPMPTPEEAARRLLERQNRRNPNPVIDMLWRIEQGVVLFLASLIPGLGERHIQAREHARRILEEEETRVREERARQDQNEQGESNPINPAVVASSNGDSKSSGPSPDSWTTQGVEASTSEASSSGVDRNAGNDEEGVRLRGGNPR